MAKGAQQPSKAVRQQGRKNGRKGGSKNWQRRGGRKHHGAKEARDTVGVKVPRNKR